MVILIMNQHPNQKHGQSLIAVWILVSQSLVLMSCSVAHLTLRLMLLWSSPLLQPQLYSQSPPSLYCQHQSPPSLQPKPHQWEMCKCIRKCTDNFSEERRKEIWKMYWDINYTDRRAFMFHSVSQLPTAKVCVDGKTSRRCRSFVYRLKNADQVPQQVCKTFFKLFSCPLWGTTQRMTVWSFL